GNRAAAPATPRRRFACTAVGRKHPGPSDVLRVQPNTAPRTASGTLVHAVCAIRRHAAVHSHSPSDDQGNPSPAGTTYTSVTRTAATPQQGRLLNRIISQPADRPTSPRTLPARAAVTGPTAAQRIAGPHTRTKPDPGPVTLTVGIGRPALRHCNVPGH